MRDWLRGQVEPLRAVQPKVRPRSEPRPATEAEIHEWTSAARNTTPPSKFDIATLREYMKAKNRRRWMRLQRDFSWVQKQMVNLGANPEDARWIL